MTDRAQAEEAARQCSERISRGWEAQAITVDDQREFILGALLAYGDARARAALEQAADHVESWGSVEHAPELNLAIPLIAQAIRTLMSAVPK